MPIAEALLCRASSLIALGFIFVPVLAAPMYLEAGIAEVFFFLRCLSSMTDHKKPREITTFEAPAPRSPKRREIRNTLKSHRHHYSLKPLIQHFQPPNLTPNLNFDPAKPNLQPNLTVVRRVDFW